MPTSGDDLQVSSGSRGRIGNSLLTNNAPAKVSSPKPVKLVGVLEARSDPSSLVPKFGRGWGTPSAPVIPACNAGNVGTNLSSSAERPMSEKEKHAKGSPVKNASDLDESFPSLSSANVGVEKDSAGQSSPAEVESPQDASGEVEYETTRHTSEPTASATNEGTAESLSTNKYTDLKPAANLAEAEETQATNESVVSQEMQLLSLEQQLLGGMQKKLGIYVSVSRSVKSGGPSKPIGSVWSADNAESNASSVDRKAEQSQKSSRGKKDRDMDDEAFPDLMKSAEQVKLEAAEKLKQKKLRETAKKEAASSVNESSRRVLGLHNLLDVGTEEEDMKAKRWAGEDYELGGGLPLQQSYPGGSFASPTGNSLQSNMGSSGGPFMVWNKNPVSGEGRLLSSKYLNGKYFSSAVSPPLPPSQKPVSLLPGFQGPLMGNITHFLGVGTMKPPPPPNVPYPSMSMSYSPEAARPDWREGAAPLPPVSYKTSLDDATIPQPPPSPAKEIPGHQLQEGFSSRSPPPGQPYDDSNAARVGGVASGRPPILRAMRERNERLGIGRSWRSESRNDASLVSNEQVQYNSSPNEEGGVGLTSHAGEGNLRFHSERSCMEATGDDRGCPPSNTIEDQEKSKRDGLLSYNVGSNASLLSATGILEPPSTRLTGFGPIGKRAIPHPEASFSSQIQQEAMNFRPQGFLDQAMGVPASQHAGYSRFAEGGVLHEAPAANERPHYPHATVDGYAHRDHPQDDGALLAGAAGMANTHSSGAAMLVPTASSTEHAASSKDERPAPPAEKPKERRRYNFSNIFKKVMEERKLDDERMQTRYEKLGNGVEGTGGLMSEQPVAGRLSDQSAAAKVAGVDHSDLPQGPPVSDFSRKCGHPDNDQHPGGSETLKFTPNADNEMNRNWRSLNTVGGSDMEKKSSQGTYPSGGTSPPPTYGRGSMQARSGDALGFTDNYASSPPDSSAVQQDASPPLHHRADSLYGKRNDGIFSMFHEQQQQQHSYAGQPSMYHMNPQHLGYPSAYPEGVVGGSSPRQLPPPHGGSPSYYSASSDRGGVVVPPLHHPHPHGSTTLEGSASSSSGGILGPPPPPPLILPSSSMSGNFSWYNSSHQTVGSGGAAHTAGDNTTGGAHHTQSGPLQHHSAGENVPPPAHSFQLPHHEGSFSTTYPPHQAEGGGAEGLPNTAEPSSHEGGYYLTANTASQHTQRGGQFSSQNGANASTADAGRRSDDVSPVIPESGGALSFKGGMGWDLSMGAYSSTALSTHSIPLTNAASTSLRGFKVTGRAGGLMDEGKGGGVSDSYHLSNMGSSGGGSSLKHQWRSSPNEYNRHVSSAASGSTTAPNSSSGAHGIGRGVHDKGQAGGVSEGGASNVEASDFRGDQRGMQRGGRAVRGISIMGHKDGAGGSGGQRKAIALGGPRDGGSLGGHNQHHGMSGGGSSTSYSRGSLSSTAQGSSMVGGSDAASNGAGGIMMGSVRATSNAAGGGFDWAPPAVAGISTHDCLGSPTLAHVGAPNASARVDGEKLSSGMGRDGISRKGEHESFILPPGEVDGVPSIMRREKAGELPPSPVDASPTFVIDTSPQRETGVSTSRGLGGVDESHSFEQRSYERGAPCRGEKSAEESSSPESYSRRAIHTQQAPATSHSRDHQIYEVAHPFQGVQVAQEPQQLHHSHSEHAARASGTSRGTPWNGTSFKREDNDSTGGGLRSASDQQQPRDINVINEGASFDFRSSSRWNAANKQNRFKASVVLAHRNDGQPGGMIPASSTYSKEGFEAGVRGSMMSHSAAKGEPAASGTPLTQQQAVSTSSLKTQASTSQELHSQSARGVATGGAFSNTGNSVDPRNPMPSTSSSYSAGGSPGRTQQLTPPFSPVREGNFSVGASVAGEDTWGYAASGGVASTGGRGFGQASVFSRSGGGSEQTGPSRKDSKGGGILGAGNGGSISVNIGTGGANNLAGSTSTSGSNISSTSNVAAASTHANASNTYSYTSHTGQQHSQPTSAAKDSVAFTAGAQLQHDGKFQSQRQQGSSQVASAGANSKNTSANRRGVGRNTQTPMKPLSSEELPAGGFNGRPRAGSNEQPPSRGNTRSGQPPPPPVGNEHQSSQSSSAVIMPGNQQHAADGETTASDHSLQFGGGGALDNLSEIGGGGSFQSGANDNAVASSSSIANGVSKLGQPLLSSPRASGAVIKSQGGAAGGASRTYGGSNWPKRVDQQHSQASLVGAGASVLASSSSSSSSLSGATGHGNSGYGGKKAASHTKDGGGVGSNGAAAASSYSTGYLQENVHNSLSRQRLRSTGKDGKQFSPSDGGGVVMSNTHPPSTGVVGGYTSSHMTGSPESGLSHGFNEQLTLSGKGTVGGGGHGGAIPSASAPWSNPEGFSEGAQQNSYHSGGNVAPSTGGSPTMLLSGGAGGVAGSAGPAGSPYFAQTVGFFVEPLESLQKSPIPTAQHSYFELQQLYPGNPMSSQHLPHHRYHHYHHGGVYSVLPMEGGPSPNALSASASGGCSDTLMHNILPAGGVGEQQIQHTHTSPSTAVATETGIEFSSPSIPVHGGTVESMLSSNRSQMQEVPGGTSSHASHGGAHHGVQQTPSMVGRPEFGRPRGLSNELSMGNRLSGGSSMAGMVAGSVSGEQPTPQQALPLSPQQHQQLPPSQLQQANQHQQQPPPPPPLLPPHHFLHYNPHQHGLPQQHEQLHNMLPHTPSTTITSRPSPPSHGGGLHSPSVMGISGDNLGVRMDVVKDVGRGPPCVNSPSSVGNPWAGGGGNVMGMNIGMAPGHSKKMMPQESEKGGPLTNVMTATNAGGSSPTGSPNLQTMGGAGDSVGEGVGTRVLVNHRGTHAHAPHTGGVGGGSGHMMMGGGGGIPSYSPQVNESHIVMPPGILPVSGHNRGIEGGLAMGVSSGRANFHPNVDDSNLPPHPYQTHYFQCPVEEGRVHSNSGSYYPQNANLQTHSVESNQVVFSRLSLQSGGASSTPQGEAVYPSQHSIPPGNSQSSLNGAPLSATHSMNSGEIDDIPLQMADQEGGAFGAIPSSSGFYPSVGGGEGSNHLVLSGAAVGPPPLQNPPSSNSNAILPPPPHGGGGPHQKGHRHSPQVGGGVGAGGASSSRNMKAENAQGMRSYGTVRGSYPPHRGGENAWSSASSGYHTISGGVAAIDGMSSGSSSGVVMQGGGVMNASVMMRYNPQPMVNMDSAGGVIRGLKRQSMNTAPKAHQISYAGHPQQHVLDNVPPASGYSLWTNFQSAQTQIDPQIAAIWDRAPSTAMMEHASHQGLQPKHSLTSKWIPQNVHPALALAQPSFMAPSNVMGGANYPLANSQVYEFPSERLTRGAGEMNTHHYMHTGNVRQTPREAMRMDGNAGDGGMSTRMSGSDGGHDMNTSRGNSGNQSAGMRMNEMVGDDSLYAQKMQQQYQENMDDTLYDVRGGIANNNGFLNDFFEGQMNGSFGQNSPRSKNFRNQQQSYSGYSTQSAARGDTDVRERSSGGAIHSGSVRGQPGSQ